MLRMHLDEAASKFVGSIEECQRNGRTYPYDRFRIETEIKNRYLGEDNPASRDQVQFAANPDSGQAVMCQYRGCRPG